MIGGGIAVALTARSHTARSRVSRPANRFRGVRTTLGSGRPVLLPVPDLEALGSGLCAGCVPRHPGPASAGEFGSVPAWGAPCSCSPAHGGERSADRGAHAAGPGWPRNLPPDHIRYGTPPEHAGPGGRPGAGPVGPPEPARSAAVDPGEFPEARGSPRGGMVGPISVTAMPGSPAGARWWTPRSPGETPGREETPVRKQGGPGPSGPAHPVRELRRPAWSPRRSWKSPRSWRGAGRRWRGPPCPSRRRRRRAWSPPRRAGAAGGTSPGAAA